MAISCQQIDKEKTLSGRVLDIMACSNKMHYKNLHICYSECVINHSIGPSETEQLEIWCMPKNHLSQNYQPDA